MTLDQNKARAFVRAVLAAAGEQHDLDMHRAGGGHDDDTAIKIKRVNYLVDAAAKALQQAIDVQSGRE